MADQDPNQGNDKDKKPKIKLGLDKNLVEPSKDKSSTRKLDLSSAEQPPVIGQPAHPKKSTSKLDLTEATIPAAKSTTTRIDAAEGAPPKKSTTRIDPSQAQPMTKHGTTRVDLSQAQPPPPKKSTTRIDPSQAAPPAGMVSGKTKTSRIDLATALPASERADEEGIVEGIPSDISDPLKSQTMRIESVPPSTGEEDIQETTGPEAAKFATQRILVDDETSSEKPTSKLKSVADLQEAKKRTSKIDLPSTQDEAEQAPDALKNRTVALQSPGVVSGGGAAASANPPTIKIKRPDTPRTRVLPKQPIPTGTVPIKSQEEAKNTTARLDLPPEDTTQRPETRPKTIRIKRPDGTSGGQKTPLKIARQGGASASSSPQSSPRTLDMMSASLEEDEGPGGVFLALTVITILVAATLLYVLLGQTFALDIPFPGRL